MCWWWSYSCKYFAKISWYFSQSCLITIHNWTNQLFSSAVDFLVFFWILFIIKPTLSEKTKVRVCLVVTLTVEAFEGVGAIFILLSFQSREIRLAITFAILHKILVVFRFVGTVVFGIFWFLNFARKCYVTSFSAVPVLKHAKIHISTSIGISNHSYVTSYIEVSVD